MKNQLLRILDKLRTSFWVIPLLCVLSAMGLAYLTYFLDMVAIPSDYHIFPVFLYFNELDNIRGVLSVVASSILGVTGVLFSVTITSLTLASQQYGPRLLRNFMQDRFNQTVLGLFIATFLYSIALLQFTSSMEIENIKPIISMSTLLALVVIDLLALVYFIHHISVSIQANSIINTVNSELRLCLNRMFPEQIKPNDNQHSEDDQPEINFEEDSNIISSQQAGYIQHIQYEKLLQLSQEYDCQINIPVKAGEFIVEDMTIAYCLSESPASEILKASIRSSITIGKHQTPIQDPEFAIRQLVEVAVRSLSPGINDPFTAISCLDRLGENIAYLLDRRFPAIHYFDDEHQLRLIVKTIRFKGIVDMSFNQIRQHGYNDVAVCIRLLETLAMLAKQVNNYNQAEVIKQQAEATIEMLELDKHADKDRQDIMQTHQRIQDALASYIAE